MPHETPDTRPSARPVHRWLHRPARARMEQALHRAARSWMGATVTTLNLNPDEVQFLYNLLDQVNVRGPEAKLAVVQIMAKIAEAAKPQSPVPAEEKRGDE